MRKEEDEDTRLAKLEIQLWDTLIGLKHKKAAEGFLHDLFNVRSEIMAEHQEVIAELELLPGVSKIDVIESTAKCLEQLLKKILGDERFENCLQEFLQGRPTFNRIIANWVDDCITKRFQTNPPDDESPER